MAGNGRYRPKMIATPSESADAVTFGSWHASAAAGEYGELRDQTGGGGVVMERMMLAISAPQAG